MNSLTRGEAYGVLELPIGRLHIFIKFVKDTKCFVSAQGVSVKRLTITSD